MNPKVRFRKLTKSRGPNCKSHDYRKQTLKSTTFIFMGIWPESAVGMVSLCQYSLLSATPETCDMSLEIYRYLAAVWL